MIDEAGNMLSHPLFEGKNLIESNKDFYRLATFKSMLAYIYFHSLDTLELDIELEKIMLSYLKKH